MIGLKMEFPSPLGELYFLMRFTDPDMLQKWGFRPLSGSYIS